MKTLNSLSLVVVVCFAIACRPFITTSLEANLFEKELAQATDPQLVDVRTFAEYSEGHLSGAILIDIKEPTFDSLIDQLDPTRPVFLYCRSGKRSLEAANVLEKKNFKVVYNLEGGIIAWKKSGKTVVGEMP